MKTLAKLIAALCLLGVIAVGLLWGLFAYVKSDLPQINSLSDYQPPINSKIFSQDGELLLEIGHETREVVAFKDIPKRIVDAFVAAEDGNFWNHQGVDYMGIARAMLVNLREGRLVQGGSTITQQVAKTLLLSKEKTLARKIKDQLLAFQIEEKFSKEDILFLYLNQVYLGGGYYGVKAAFDGYFGKPLEEATVAEAALVAGLLSAPGKYSPYVNPRHAKARQLYVIKRLYDENKITVEEYEAAKKEVIKIKMKEAVPMKGGHFTDYVRQVLLEKMGKDAFMVDGYQVTTTLNWKLQNIAEQSLKKHVRDLDRRQGFSGPVSVFETQEAQLNELKTQRHKLFREASTFFEFTLDGVNRYEFDQPEESWEKLNEWSQAEDKKVKSVTKDFFLAGNQAQDPLIPVLKLEKNYSTMVLLTNDSHRLITVSLAGTRGVIQEAEFSWAHPRVLSEDPKYFSPLTKPSTILKPGHVVYVRLLQKNPVSYWEAISEEAKKKIKDKKMIETLKSQKVLIFGLEQKPEAEGAFVAMDPKTGEIFSMVGGIDFAKSQFNRALQAKRQSGSSFKPFIYAAGLENGYTPNTLLLDTPQALGGSDDNLSWKPRNYDGEFMGQMTFRKALEISRNIPTIRILQEVSVEKMHNFVERLGLQAEMPKDMSISLGSFGMSLTELTRAYALFANGGKNVQMKFIKAIRDRENKSYDIPGFSMQATEPVSTPFVESTATSQALQENNTANNTDNKEQLVKEWEKYLSADQVYDPRLAYVMTALLKGVVQSGTGAAAGSLSSNLAGKTGTTSNYVDALFVGYSPFVVAGAWVGFDNNQTMGYGETGGKTALPIWMDYMREALAYFGDAEFPQPPGVYTKLINKGTGKVLLPGQENGFLETFAEGMDESGRLNEISQGEQPSQNSVSGDGQEQKTQLPTPALDDEDYYLNQ